MSHRVEEKLGGKISCFLFCQKKIVYIYRSLLHHFYTKKNWFVSNILFCQIVISLCCVPFLSIWKNIVHTSYHPLCPRWLLLQWCQQVTRGQSRPPAAVTRNTGQSLLTQILKDNILFWDCLHQTEFPTKNSTVLSICHKYSKRTRYLFLSLVDDRPGQLWTSRKTSFGKRQMFL